MVDVSGLESGSLAMSSVSNTIFVMDDDADVCAALFAILTRAGYGVLCFSDAQSLLSVNHAQAPACVLLDLFVPGSSGLDVLKTMEPSTYPAPVLLMSGHGFVLAAAVDAMRNGAYDFIEKPFTGNELLKRITRARCDFSARRAAAEAPSALPDLAGVELLTSREQQVLALWVVGATSKEIARKLGISPRTVDIHRSKIMKKMHAKNSAEIVNIAVSNSAAFGIHLNCV
jgi:FixJ family two-component response regulator